MHKIINIVLFLLLSTFSLNAEIVRNLKVIGNERVSDETIKVYGDIQLGKNYKESDLNKDAIIFGNQKLKYSELLDKINSEQIEMIFPYIEVDYWKKRFVDYLADTEFVKHILDQAGL